MCTVMICDDQAQLRETLTLVLSQQPHLSVVGQAADASSCLTEVSRLQPDLLVLDFNLPGGGPGLARAVKEAGPATYLLVYTGDATTQTRDAMLEAGADEVLVKTGRLRPLLDALQGACDGKRQ